MSAINGNIEAILKYGKTIAVVGLSDKPHRASHRVARVMSAAGYTVIPVNPHLDELWGKAAFSRLADIHGPVDVVNVFRRAEHVDGIVDEAIEIGARAVWLQLGIIAEGAARRAMDAGLDVVMDRCWAVEYRRWAV